MLIICYTFYFFIRLLFGFSGIRKFRFHIRFGFVWVNIHDGGFGYGRNHVVCHCTFHSFVQFLYSVAKVGSLYQYGSGGLFLCSAFFVQRDEEQLALKPAVGCIFLQRGTVRCSWLV